MAKGNGIYPEDLRYTREHEWIAVHGDIATVGVTHYAQGELGDIVYLELPAAGTPIVAGEEFGTIESVKAVSELYAPASGEVIETNSAVAQSPEIVNRDPYHEGWLIKVRLADPTEIEALMNVADYRKFVEDEAN